ncbi:hypothetical protein B0H17DRAFT_1183110 [Mycena rosella]|uniref:Uncharacterized protein n=1 Tax=Mycena rosella TaxID=1033263 RepID=A0AAD7G9X3_MYCRO|nr:hypothetical protein B0H17DRAFT_1183110 [Mycena rosella]
MDMGEPNGNRGGATAHPGEVQPYGNTDPRFFILVSPSSMSLSSVQDAEENREPAEFSSTALTISSSALDQSDQCNPNCPAVSADIAGHSTDPRVMPGTPQRIGTMSLCDVECTCPVSALEPRNGREERRVDAQAKPQPGFYEQKRGRGTHCWRRQSPVRRTRLLCALGARTARCVLGARAICAQRPMSRERRLNAVDWGYTEGNDTMAERSPICTDITPINRSNKWVLGVVDGSDESSSSLAIEIRPLRQPAL